MGVNRGRRARATGVQRGNRRHWTICLACWLLVRCDLIEHGLPRGVRLGGDGRNQLVELIAGQRWQGLSSVDDVLYQLRYGRDCGGDDRSPWVHRIGPPTAAEMISK